MTKINIYCLFDTHGSLHGVYSSIKAVHRDALSLCNKGHSSVYIHHPSGDRIPNVTLLRNLFKGEMDVKIRYFSDKARATILKTGLRE